MVFHAQICPNCGAPLTLEGHRCKFCQIPLVDPSLEPSPEPAESPPPDPNGPFAMLVEDVFSIAKRGTVATGRIHSGSIRVGDRMVIDGLGGVRTTECSGIEVLRKTLDTATAGDTVGLLLRGVKKPEIVRGDWLRLA